MKRTSMNIGIVLIIIGAFIFGRSVGLLFKGDSLLIAVVPLFSAIAMFLSSYSVIQGRNAYCIVFFVCAICFMVIGYRLEPVIIDIFGTGKILEGSGL